MYSVAVGKGVRPYSIAGAILPVAETVKSRSADGLMGAGGVVLPCAKGRFANPIG